VAPAVTFTPFGFTVIATSGAVLTVRIPGLLVTLPAELLTTTVKCAPSSAAVVVGVVYLEEVTPLMAIPFLLH
jgi:ABC-type phosphate transport system auxiliary subunit